MSYIPLTTKDDIEIDYGKDGSGALIFKKNGSEIARFDTSGNLDLSVGSIIFPDDSVQTQAASVSPGLTSLTNITFNYDSDANGTGTFAIQRGGSGKLSLDNSGNVTMTGSATANYLMSGDAVSVNPHSGYRLLTVGTSGGLVGQNTATINLVYNGYVNQSSGAWTRLISDTSTLFNATATGFNWQYGAGTTSPITFATVMSLNSAGTLNFALTGSRITGDMSNATFSNRLGVQNSVTNGNTALSVLPNGTGTVARINLFNTSNPDAAGYVSIFVSGTNGNITSTNNGGSLPTTLAFSGFTSGYTFDQALTVNATGSRISAGTDTNTNFYIGSGGGSPTAGRQINLILNTPHSGGNVGSAQILFGRNSDAGDIWQMGIDSTGSSGAKASNTDFWWYGGSNYRMALTTAGVLRLYGDNTAINLATATGTNSRYITISNTGGNGYVGLDNSAGTGFAAGGSAYALSLWHDAARSIVFATNNTKRVEITSTGNTTITPGSNSTEVLRVNGSAGTSWFRVDTTNGQIVVGSAAGRGQIQLSNASNNSGFLMVNEGGSGSSSLVLYRDASQVFKIDTSGNVSVGTTSASAVTGQAIQVVSSGLLQATNTGEFAIRYNAYYDGTDRWIQASNKATALVMDSTGSFIFYNTNTASTGAGNAITGWGERLRIDSNGNVVIGSATVATDSPGINVRTASADATRYALLMEQVNTGANAGIGIDIRLYDSASAAASAATVVARKSAAWTSGSAGTYDSEILVSTRNDNTLAERMRIFSHGHVTVGNVVTDTFSSGPALTIDQGTNDGNILTFQSTTDVAHGMTTYADTNTFAAFRKAGGIGTAGGLEILALSEATYTFTVAAYGTNADTTKSTSALATVLITAGKKSGTGTASLGANGNMFAIADFASVRWIVDVEGDTHRDGTDNTYDAWDDAHLARAFDLEMSPKTKIDNAFDQYVKYNRQHLIDAGIMSEGGFYNESRLLRMHNGAIWQLYTKVEEMKALDEREVLRSRIEELERKIARFEALLPPT